jgi:hypothetical protein
LKGHGFSRAAQDQYFRGFSRCGIAKEKADHEHRNGDPNQSDH